MSHTCDIVFLKSIQQCISVLFHLYQLEIENKEKLYYKNRSKKYFFAFDLCFNIGVGLRRNQRKSKWHLLQFFCIILHIFNIKQFKSIELNLIFFNFAQKSSFNFKQQQRCIYIFIYLFNNYFCGLYTKIMNKSKTFQQNEKLLIQAFNFQNIEAYDEAYQKLQIVGHNLISLIENIQKNTQFYMRVMPILKQQRQLISEKDYKQFIHKNQRVLCKSIEQNAYLALLMQQMQHKINKQIKKWGANQDASLYKMVEQGCSFQEIQQKFGEFDIKQLKKRYQKVLKRISASAMAVEEMEKE